MTFACNQALCNYFWWRRCLILLDDRPPIDSMICPHIQLKLCFSSEHFSAVKHINSKCVVLYLKITAQGLLFYSLFIQIYNHQELRCTRMSSSHKTGCVMSAATVLLDWKNSSAITVLFIHSWIEEVHNCSLRAVRSHPGKSTT